jgi:hypothetical protein
MTRYESELDRMSRSSQNNIYSKHLSNILQKNFHNKLQPPTQTTNIITIKILNLEHKP